MQTKYFGQSKDKLLYSEWQNTFRVLLPLNTYPLKRAFSFRKKKKPGKTAETSHLTSHPWAEVCTLKGKGWEVLQQQMSSMASKFRALTSTLQHLFGMNCNTNYKGKHCKKVGTILGMVRHRVNAHGLDV